MLVLLPLEMADTLATVIVQQGDSALTSREHKITWTALRKDDVSLFCRLFWRFGIEQRRAFCGEISVVSVSQEEEHNRNILEEFSEHSEYFSLQISGPKNNKFGELRSATSVLAKDRPKESGREGVGRVWL